MNKVQMIELLKLRGITKLDKGQSIANTIEQSGGEPSLAEMVKVNPYFIEECHKRQRFLEHIGEIMGQLKNKEPGYPWTITDGGQAP